MATGNLYDKLIEPVQDIRISAEALLSGAFGRMGGDQREGIKQIYANAGGLYTLFMDVITSVGLENVAQRSYLRNKFTSYLEPIKSRGQALLDGVDGPLDEEQALSIEYVVVTSDTLAGFVDLIWQYSQLHHQLLPLRPNYFNIPDMLRRVRVPAFHPRLRIILSVENNMPLAYADEARIHDCVRHLVENAARFTRGESVTIRVQRVVDVIQVEVIDDGLGIPVTEQERIFEPFYQIDNTVEGLGLGLAIVTHIMSQHGGTVRLLPGDFPGSRFVLAVPVTRKAP